MTFDKDLHAATLRRVQKLLAIANDTRADANEAAAAASQAEKIMRKFQLEHTDVLAEQLRTAGGGMGRRKVRANWRLDHAKTVPVWASWIGVRVAQLHDCIVSISTHEKFGACLQFSGHEDDTQIAEWTLEYLLNALQSAATRFQREADRSKADSASYRRGFALALCQNLQNAKRAKDQEVSEGAATGRSLVVLKMQVVAEHFGPAKYKTQTSSSISSGDGYARGRADGNKIDVGRRAVGSSSNSSTKRLAA